jgi:hypothetical protein
MINRVLEEPSMTLTRLSTAKGSDDRERILEASGRFLLHGQRMPEPEGLRQGGGVREWRSVGGLPMTDRADARDLG